MSKKTIIIVSGFVLIGVIGLILFFVLHHKQPELVTEQVAEQILTRDERAKGLVPSGVHITKQTETYIRGTVRDERDGIDKHFFLMRINDEWRVIDVARARDTISCERFVRLGFPDDFITDCELTFADAVTVADIDRAFNDFPLETLGLRVIGFVTDVEQTDTGSLVTLVSGSARTVVAVAETTITPNDIVVITIIEPVAATSTTPTTGVRTGSDVVIVGAEDKTLPYVPENPAQTIPQEKIPSATSTPVTGDATTPEPQKTKAPYVIPAKSYFYTTDDIDTSFTDIQIDGSF